MGLFVVLDDNRQSVMLLILVGVCTSFVHSWSNSKTVELLNMIRWNVIWKWILSLQTQWTLSTWQMKPEREMRFWSRFEKSPSIGRDDLKRNGIPWMRVTLPIWKGGGGGGVKSRGTLLFERFDSKRGLWLKKEVELGPDMHYMSIISMIIPWKLLRCATTHVPWE